MKQLFCFVPVLLLTVLVGRELPAQNAPLYPNVVSTTADPLLTNLSIPANAASQGMWSSTFFWPLVGIQSTVMPDGRVLTEGTAPGVAGVQDGRYLDFWSPMQGLAVASHFTAANAQNVDSFCGSVSILPGTGDVMLTGGAGASYYTSFLSTLVTPSTTYIRGSGSSLAAQRWYATMITLADGRALIGGGGVHLAVPDAYQDPTGSLPSISVTPELYTPQTSSWQTLQNATSLDAFGPTNNRSWYPRMWVAPDASVFGISTEKVWDLNTANWTIATLRDFKTTINTTTLPNVGPTSTAVMYDVGKILQVGGNGYNNGYPSPSSPYATIFDITNAQSPVITETQPMHEGRQWANSLVMPDGQVLVTGGTTYGDSNGVNNVPATEMWNPNSGAWQLGASAASYRGYHSTTALLQDGTVLSLGGGVPGPVENTNGEIYYPPYLFAQSGSGSVLASRPRIVSVDNLQQSYGQPIRLEMADSSSIVEASLIGLSSTTHSFNSFQRRVKLTVSQYGVVATVTMPQSSAIAPPGYYLLTVLNGNRVPSAGVIVALNAPSVAQQGVTASTTSAVVTPYTTSPTASQIGQGFSKVAAASDGTLVGISSSTNQLYISRSGSTANTQANFTLMPSFSARDVAVLNANSVYAIGMDYGVWHWNGTWTRIGDNVISIAASADGAIVTVNASNNSILRKLTDDNQLNWQGVPNFRALRVALVNQTSLYGIGMDGHLWHIDPAGVNFYQFAATINDLAATSDGSVEVLTTDGRVLRKTGNDNTEVWTQIQTNGAQVARVAAPNQTTAILTYANGNVGRVVDANATVLNLASYYNVNAVGTAGSSPLNGGFDSAGYAFSTSTVGPTATYAGLTFTLGPANAADAVAGKVIPLPSGKYTSLVLLGSASYGPLTGQTFTVTYTDGTTSTYQQSMSDWCNPNSFQGETIVTRAINRLNPDGSTNNLPVNLYGYTFALAPGKNPVSLTLPASGKAVFFAVGMKLDPTAAIVNLASSYNVNAIVTAGAAPLNGGMDAAGYAFSSGTVGTGASYAGMQFTYGPANVADAVAGKTISLPAGNYTSLVLLGSAAFGPLTGQAFTVTYSDGSTSAYQQNMSDWANPRSFPGETTVTQAVNRLNPDGSTNNLPVNVYGYTFALTPGKVPVSLTLPASRQAVIFGVGVKVDAPSTVVNLAPYYNTYSIGATGSAVTNGGFDTSGYAYASNTIGSGATYAGVQFTYGSANVADAVAGKTISLPAGNYTSLVLLGSAAFGPLTGQAFTVTYSDGSTSAYQQNMSDWANPRSFPGETTVTQAVNRLNPDGSTNNLPVNVYGYTFALTPGKVPVSLTLPASRQAVIFGVGVK